MKYNIYFSCHNCIFYKEGEKDYAGWCKQGMWKTKWIGVLGTIVEKSSCKEIEAEWSDHDRKGIMIFDIHSSDGCDKFKFNSMKAEKYMPKFFFTVSAIAKLINMSETTVRKYITQANIQSKYNYQDNSGRWASSYSYYTYDLYAVVEGFKQINKENKALIVDEYIKGELTNFNQYIVSISS